MTFERVRPVKEAKRMNDKNRTNSKTASRAVRLASFGGPELLEVLDVHLPAGRPGADPGACRGGSPEPDGLGHCLG